MTITRDVREKVIQLSKEGRGRNEIARLLNGQGLHISEGSVGNITRAYREQSLQLSHEHSLQKESSCVVAVNTSQSSQGPKTDATISTPIDMNYTGSPVSRRQGVGLANVVIPKDGGPLSHLLNENMTTTATDSIYCRDTTPQTKPSGDLPKIKDPEPDDIINQDINSQEQDDGEEERNFNQPEPSKEDPKIKPLGTWDPDSDDAWDKRFLRIVMDDKRQRQEELQLIENGKRELEEERQQIELMRQSVRQQINDLKAMEDKLKEIEPLLPSVRELHNAGITFDIIMPYMIAINEKSALEKIDLKTAAYNMRQDFIEYRNIENLRIIIAGAEKRLKILADHIRQNEFAINTLIKLKSIGYTEKQIMKLMATVNGSKNLDTELIDVGNLQQSNVNGKSQQPTDILPPQPSNSGNNGGR